MLHRARRHRLTPGIDSLRRKPCADKRPAADYWGVMFDLTEAIKKRFDQDGIAIPFPQREVRLLNGA